LTPDQPPEAVQDVTFEAQVSVAELPVYIVVELAPLALMETVVYVP